MVGGALHQVRSVLLSLAVAAVPQMTSAEEITSAKPIFMETCLMGSHGDTYLQTDPRNAFSEAIVLKKPLKLNGRMIPEGSVVFNTAGTAVVIDPQDKFSVMPIDGHKVSPSAVSKTADLKAAAEYLRARTAQA